MNRQSGTTGTLQFVVTSKILDRYTLGDLGKILGLCVLLLVPVLGTVAWLSKDDPDAPRILGWMAGLMILTFFSVALIGVLILYLNYRRGITRTFQLDADGVRYGYGKTLDTSSSRLEDSVALAANLTGNVHWRSYVERERANRNLAWPDIARFRAHDDDLVIQLYRGRIPAMRIYCPDMETYRQTLSMVRSHVAP